MVNKIPTYLDNPIDTQIYKHIDKYLPLLNKYNVTPNHLTAISLLFGLSTSYFLYYDSYLLAGLTWFIAYYFDCADGKMARAYDMVTQFGDYFDHGSDTLKCIIILYVIYLKLKGKKMTKLLILIFVLLAINIMLVASHFGCQEKVSRDIRQVEINDAESLAMTEGFIITDCYTQMGYTKYVGSGTLVLFSSLLLVFWDKIVPK